MRKHLKPHKYEATIKSNENMLKKYYKPTPVRIRKLGDALLGISLMGIPAELSGHTWISLSLFAFGVIGKFLTNFFTEE